MASCVECLHYNVCYKKPIRNVDTELVMIGDCSDYKPTADVEEVKHGEWKKVECGTICTNCNRVYDNDFEFSYKQIKEYFKRCPECGAKMDGGKENER